MTPSIAGRPQTAAWLIPIACLAAVLAATAAEAPGPVLRRAADPSLAWGPCPELFPTGCQIAVLRGDPSRPNADVFFRVPGGYTIPPHTHTSAEHLVLVEGELEVRYAGNAAIVMKTGDFAYGPAKHAHQGRCLSRTPCTLYIAFEQPVDALAHAGPLP